MKVLTSAAMKIAESAAVEQGSSYLELMERAGAGAAKQILALVDVTERPVLVLCGKGNNGGDGLVVARHLVQAGGEATVLFLMGRELSALSRSNLYALEGLPVTLMDGASLPEEEWNGLFRSAGVVVDAVFGTGFSGDLPERCREALDEANRSSAVKIALDVPSGVDCDTGLFDPHSFQADVTYAFAAYKPAHLLKSSRALCGRLELVDIGIPEVQIASIADGVTVIRPDLAAHCIPRRREDSNKGDYGRLLDIGGCRNMTGAVILSALAAMRSGVGLVKVATAQPVVPLVGGRLLECIHHSLPTAGDGSISVDAADELREQSRWATAVLVGCGLSVTEDTKLLVEDLIASSCRPLVIDADGLNCIASNPDMLLKAHVPVILTPHMKEMSRLTGLPVEVVKARRFDVAAQFASKYGVTVVLKDANTVIATPKGERYLSDNGNAGMAKGGSGDVLAGIIASLLAQGAPTVSAAVAGVYLHAAAGDMAAQNLTQYAMLPSDLIDELPYVFRSFI
ncbi:MAG: NAD(P)H-hydrate dehydratase [Candidatus Merdivicinus sp.]|jgi:hydroxyethylthiazole kinase-like uncharacterized protein yjeF